MMVNPIDFGGHSSNVKVAMGIIDKFGVRGDGTLCVVIFLLGPRKMRVPYSDRSVRPSIRLERNG